MNKGNETMGNIENIIKQILSRKDPHGYFVIIAVKNNESKAIIDKYLRISNLIIGEVGDVIIIRGRSREVIEKLARSLATRKLLAELK
ncbi:MAG: hypothetical protein QXW36_04625 [Desulfurococcaceae archaeon]